MQLTKYQVTSHDPTRSNTKYCNSIINLQPPTGIIWPTSYSQTCLIRLWWWEANLIQSNLSYQATVMRGQPHTVKPVLSDHCGEKPTSYSQTCLIRPLSWDTNLIQSNLSYQTMVMRDQPHTVKPVLSGHCHEANLIQSNLSYQTMVMRDQPHTVKPVLSGHCDEKTTSYSQTCLIKPLWWEDNLIQSNLSYQTIVVRG